MADQQQFIHSVIDKSINYSNQYFGGLQEHASLVPEAMLDLSRRSHVEDIVYWKPIPAAVTATEFSLYEQKIGYPLPVSYKQFLSYKYFISLNFLHDADFFRHTPHWVEDYLGYVKIDDEEVNPLQAGFIPFARDGESGFFCFDANHKAPDNEYKIITYDPTFEETPLQQFTFMDLLKEFDQRLSM